MRSSQSSVPPIRPASSRSPATFSDSDSTGEGISGPRGCARSPLTLWFCAFCILSFVHGVLSICHFFCSFCFERFLGPLGRSTHHKRCKFIRGAGSQAAARGGARPRHVALASLVHGRDQTFWSKWSIWLSDASPVFLPPLQVWVRRFLRDCFVRLLHTSSSTHLGLSGACIPVASWLLVFAMSRFLSSCHADRAHLGGFLRPELASFASWFSGFPCGMGASCFTHMFLWFCFTHCCLLVFGYEALRPATAVLFPLFQAVVSTPIN